MKRILFSVFLLASITILMAQPQPNYDESKVPVYQLPGVLINQQGKAVNTVSEWEQQLRPATLNLFATEMFGRIPADLHMTDFRIVEEGTDTPYTNARRRQIELILEKGNQRLTVGLLIYTPISESPAPLFLGYNFYGNHTVTDDPKVFISNSWANNNEAFGVFDNRLSEQSRGVRTNRWAIAEILEAGYGIGVMFYGDVDPDYNDFGNGVHPFSYNDVQQSPAPDEWGALAAWAWGLSRAMDFLETDNYVDATRVAVMGHSRLGKAALWAGAIDERFAMVISNNSGCGGAALSRRKYGETVERINTAFPHWFAGNFKKYNNKEELLPFDQHQLIALMAPRPIYIASAVNDRWADPKGEYLSGVYATPVYSLYGYEGLPSLEMPAVQVPVMHRIGYHIREGGHDVTPYDWQQFIQFARLHFDGR